MKKVFQTCAVGVLAIVISSCGSSSDPGPLKGSWHLDGLVPMTVTYRNGEEEAMGLIEKVSYKRDGNDVLVTYLDGMAKGTTLRITITGQDSAQTELGNLRRIK